MNIYNANKKYDKYSNNDEISDDGYESPGEINLEITDCIDGTIMTQIYSIPYRPTHCNEKRLICYSTINEEACNYGNNCTYAHNLSEQVIDDDKLYMYQVVLDKKMMDFYSLTNPKTEEIYANLKFLSDICTKCTNKKCTGGYNCRNGACSLSVKMCRNDLLTGGCLNKIIDIDVDKSLCDKLSSNDFEPMQTYKGCINGHHLTLRGLLPYYKYVHQKENYRKNRYRSVRYVDVSQLNKVFNKKDCNIHNIKNNVSDSESTTDEEISSWFQQRNVSDDENSSE